MGSIQDIDAILVEDGQNLKQAQESVIELASETDQNGFRSFKIDTLEANAESCLTGMRDELVLLSWSIVLLRTSEDGQASFEWAYKAQFENLQSQSLNTGQVISSLQESVQQAGAEILQHIRTSSVDRSTPIPNPASLILSTSLLSQTSNELDDKVSK